MQFLPSKREFIHGGKKREDDKRVFLHSKRLDDAPWQRLNSDVDQEKRIFLHSKRGDEVDNGFNFPQSSADLLKRYLSSPFHQNFLEIVSEDPEDRNLDSKRAFLHGKRTFLHSKRPADREEYAELYEGNNLVSNPDKKNFLHGKRLFLHSKRKSTDPVEEKRIFLHSKRDDDDDDLNRV